MFGAGEKVILDHADKERRSPSASTYAEPDESKATGNDDLDKYNATRWPI